MTEPRSASASASESVDLAYADTAEGPLLGRLYLRAGTPPRALALHVHGGGWCSGDRLQDAGVCAALAEHGVAVFSIDFRMPPGHRYPVAVQDVAAALHWLQQNAGRWGCDARQVGLMGFSSGGHLAALVALQAVPAALPASQMASQTALPALPCAWWIGCWPVLDPLGRYRLAALRAREDLLRNHAAFWADADEMHAGSPQRVVAEGRFAALPPVLLVQGTEDENLDPAMTTRFAQGYRERGGSAELLSFPGEPHAFMKRNPGSDATRQALAAMVRFALAGGRAAPL